jgi:hypothetical protein
MKLPNGQCGPSIRRRRGFRKSVRYFRYWMNSGKHMLLLSFSGFDPACVKTALDDIILLRFGWRIR